MKTRNLVVMVWFLATAVVFSQRTVERSVGDFKQIKVYDLIAVNMIASQENKVLVKGDNVDDIQIVNKNGELKIKMALNKIFHGENTVVEVYYTHVELIDGNEGAQIKVKETLKMDALELRTQEGAAIKVNAQVGRLNVRAVTGGQVQVSGETKQLDVVLNTGGIFEGKDMKSTTASIKISAAGNAMVFASDKVDVNIKAGGDVTVYGNPKEVNKNTFAGGRVKIMD